MAALRAAGVAGEKGLVAFGQRPGGKAGAGILHRDGKAAAGGMEGQGYFASAGRVAHRVVQQVAHRPVKADAVHRHAARRRTDAVKGDLFCGAKALAGALPAFCQQSQLHRLFPSPPSGPEAVIVRSCAT